MLKKVVILFCLSFVPAYSWAQGSDEYAIRAGDRSVFVMVGGAGSSQKLEGSKWADGGIEYGAQAMFFLSKYIGVGFEISGTNFRAATTTESGSEYGMISSSGCGFGVYPTPCYGDIEFRGKDKIKTSVMHFMLSGRATVNPDSRVRFYIPMGLGLVRTNVTIDSVYSIHTSLEDVTESSHIKSHKMGFSWYIGGGIEATIYKNILVGIEGRYNQFDLKISGVESTYHPHYFSGIAKIGYKF